MGLLHRVLVTSERSCPWEYFYVIGPLASTIPRLFNTLQLDTIIPVIPPLLSARSNAVTCLARLLFHRTGVHYDQI